MIVRSRMPGSVAIGTCAPSYTRCSYTSSVMQRTSCSRQSSARNASSSGVKTLPVGLCGELIRIARVAFVKHPRTSSRSSAQSGPRSAATLGTAPAIRTLAL